MAKDRYLCCRSVENEKEVFFFPCGNEVNLNFFLEIRDSFGCYVTQQCPRSRNNFELSSCDYTFLKQFPQSSRSDMTFALSRPHSSSSTDAFHKFLYLLPNGGLLVRQLINEISLRCKAFLWHVFC